MSLRNDLQKPSGKFFLLLLTLSMLTVVASCYAGFAPSKSNAPDPSPSARLSVLTYHNNNSRTGLNSNETILTPANVNPKQFGKIGALRVKGTVDAEPLYVKGLTINGKAHNAIFVATEDDMVYAFDADTFKQLWSANMLAKYPGESTVTTSEVGGCPQVSPELGITSTPVIDLSAGPHGTIYVVAMSVDSSHTYHQRLHALDLTTGADRMTPREIRASYPNASGHTSFAPHQYEERAALLALNGVIYTTWTSHCDFKPYTGWVMGYSESNLKQTSVIDLTPNGSDGAIWMAGDGPAADSSGNIYFILGNGSFDTQLNAKGFPKNGDYGNSFMKLSTAHDSLRVADYFTMSNTAAESRRDQDFGSGGELLLPPLTNSSGTVEHLAIGAGKDTNLYIVNRRDMGKFNPKGDGAIYQQLDGVLPGGAWSSPAYFDNVVYYDSVGHPMKAFPISKAKLASTPSSHTTFSFGYPSATPSISSNGTKNGIVWAAVVGTGSGFHFVGKSTGVLYALDATNLSKELYNSNMSGSRDTYPTDRSDKFITPLIAGGKVYVGTPNAVVVFGLLKR